MSSLEYMRIFLLLKPVCLKKKVVVSGFPYYKICAINICASHPQCLSVAIATEEKKDILSPPLIKITEFA